MFQLVHNYLGCQERSTLVKPYREACLSWAQLSHKLCGAVSDVSRPGMEGGRTESRDLQSSSPRTPLHTSPPSFQASYSYRANAENNHLASEPQGKKGGEKGSDLLPCCCGGFEIFQTNCYPKNLIYYVESMLFVSGLAAILNQ